MTESQYSDIYPASVIQDFYLWMRENQTAGIRGRDLSVQHFFLPDPKLKEYFTEDRIQKLLNAIFLHEHPLVNAGCIWSNYQKCLAILLQIRKARYVEAFSRHSNLRDVSLPFRSCPDNFPNPDFFEEFKNTQWQFCAPQLKSKELIHTFFEPERILPIISREKWGEGGSAVVYKITIHPGHNKLRPRSQLVTDSQNPLAFALKTFQKREAEEEYNREVSAHNELMPVKQYESYKVEYYGSYEQDNTYNVISEFADGGSLESHFQNVDPPTNAEDTMKFWRSLLKLSTPLMQIHQVDSNAKPVGLSHRNGFHQDIKPDNILVFRDHAVSFGYGYKFKLSDYGNAHFSRALSSGKARGEDSHGTRTYGAPDCYRLNNTDRAMKLHITPAVDIWSLGCVYLEGSIWVVLGPKYLQQFRNERKKETDSILDFQDGNCFHDGEKPLKIVRDYLNLVKDNVRASDKISPSVLGLIDKMLSQDPNSRPSARELYKISKKLMQPDRDWSHLESVASGSHPGYGIRNCAPQELRSSARTPPQLPNDPNLFPSGPSQRHCVSEGCSDKPNGECVDESGCLTGTVHPTASDTNRFHLPKEGLHSKLPFSPQEIKAASTTASSHHINNGHQSDMAEPDLTSVPFSEGSSSRQPAGKGNSVPTLILGNQVERQGDAGNTNTYTPREGNRGEASPIAQGQVDPSRDSSTEGNTSHRESFIDSNAIASGTSSPEMSISEAQGWMNSRKNRTLMKRLFVNRSPERLIPERIARKLESRDLVFLIDDSTSMGKYRSTVEYVFETITYHLKHSDPDGLELYFASSNECHREKKGCTKGLINILKSKGSRNLTASSNVFEVMAHILQQYQDQLEEYATRNAKEPRPIILYILTNTSENLGKNPIIKMVNYLEEQGNFPKDQVGVQFIQFGNYPETTRCLGHLDRLDKEEYLGRDIVDVEPANGNFLKMIAGSIDKRLDNDSSSSLDYNPS